MYRLYNMKMYIANMQKCRANTDSEEHLSGQGVSQQN